MRYYYHIRVGDERIEDMEGSEHPSVEAAVQEARDAAKQILRQDIRAGIKLDDRKLVRSAAFGASLQIILVERGCRPKKLSDWFRR